LVKTGHSPLTATGLMRELLRRIKATFPLG
jgi:hypothetical protein